MGRPSYLTLGRVVRPHGVRGEITVLLFADSWRPFMAQSRLWVGRPGSAFRPVALEAAREHGRSVILKLAGVDSREAAAGLVGCEVALPRSEAPPPPEGTFYHYDILGLEVVDGTAALGSVEEILETPAHDVYVIRGSRGEWMLPATRAHIRRIDLAAGRIEIVPTAGLLSPPPEGDADAEPV